LFPYLKDESPDRRRIRYAMFWMTKQFPWKIGLAVRRVKLSGLIPIPLLFPPYFIVVPTFAFQSRLEYHIQHCDLSEFTGYCPKSRRFYSMPINYCPQCMLSLARLRGYPLTPDQVVLIDQRQRMIGPISRPLAQEDLIQTLPREHIFPPLIQFCPL